MAEHTPGPLSLSRDEEEGIILSGTGELPTVAHVRGYLGCEQDMANAEFLALAWNSHDELLAALEGLVRLDDHPLPGTPAWTKARLQAHLDARAAIKKVKGG